MNKKEKEGNKEPSQIRKTGSKKKIKAC